MAEALIILDESGLVWTSSDIKVRQAEDTINFLLGDRNPAGMAGAKIVGDMIAGLDSPEAQRKLATIRILQAWANILTRPK